jgi:hypothetical protein
LLLWRRATIVALLGRWAAVMLTLGWQVAALLAWWVVSACSGALVVVVGGAAGGVVCAFWVNRRWIVLRVKLVWSLEEMSERYVRIWEPLLRC